MRQLRFVSLAENGHAILQSDDAEQFALVVDDRLRTAVTAPPPAEPAPVAAEPVVADPIGPREIQMRVRAGEEPAALAVACGMSVDRVMRFAGAVLDERRRIAGEARRARARRSGSDAGENRFVVFGEAVDERFAGYGIAVDAVAWDARRREDGEWLVTATWARETEKHAAEWLFSRSSRTVTPLDEAASDLLSDKPIRPVASPPPRPSLAAAPPLAPGVVAFPPMPDAHTGPVPVVEEVFDQEAPPEGPHDAPPLVPAAAALDFDEPPLPLGITEATTRPIGALRNLGAGRRAESDEEKAARARIPSWDDILLGIRRKD